MKRHVFPYVHATEGRLRIKIPPLKRSPEKAACVRRELEQLDGVDRIEANPLTGNVLVLFDPARLGRESIFEALKTCGFPWEGELSLANDATYATVNGSAAPGEWQQWARRVLRSVGFSLMEAGVKRLVLTLILA